MRTLDDRGIVNDSLIVTRKHAWGKTTSMEKPSAETLELGD